MLQRRYTFQSPCVLMSPCCVWGLKWFPVIDTQTVMIGAGAVPMLEAMAACEEDFDTWNLEARSRRDAKAAAIPLLALLNGGPVQENPVQEN